jgi:hypothetical protein
MKTATKTEVKEGPILFSAPMIKAILEGKKTQTRRIVKPQPNDVGYGNKCEVHPYCTGTKWPLAYYERRNGLWNSSQPLKCPYGKVGDRLWVRESFADVTAAFDDADEMRHVAFRADNSVWDCYGQMLYLEQLGQSGIYVDKWKPSIHMPRFASRITLEITNIRVERVQDISADDAQAEGMTCPECKGIGSEDCYCNASDWVEKEEFQRLWKEINGPDSWQSNPFVWVIEFKKV